LLSTVPKAFEISKEVKQKRRRASVFLDEMYNEKESDPLYNESSNI